MIKTSNILVKKRLGCLWITLNNPIDMDNYKTIEDNIFMKIDEYSPNSFDLVLDLSKTVALFSSGLGVIMRIQRYAMEHKKKFFLVNVSEKVHEGLCNVGLDKILNIYPSIEALKSNLQEIPQ